MQEDQVRQQAQEIGLEERLYDYYGPEQREQPLSQTAWRNLQSRLGTQGVARRRFRWPIRLVNTGQLPPTSIQIAFKQVIDEARVSYIPGMLRCTFTMKADEPACRALPWRKNAVHLLLPLVPARTIEQSAIDILLATGLAQHILMRRARYWLIYSGTLLPALLGCIGLYFTWRHFLFIGIPIAILLFVAIGWLLNWQKRTRVLAADMLAVLWLGRSRTCQGLHALADSSHRPYHRKWGTPSLEERIRRVCGTHVDVLDDSLTLVR